MFTARKIVTSAAMDKLEMNPWLPETWTVKEAYSESADTVTINIEPCTGPMPAVRPGQFNMAYVFGVGEIPVSFSSISSTSHGHTIRNVGSVSAALCKLEPGSKIGIRGPFGSCWDQSLCENRDVVIVAGGLGIAPLKPLIEALANSSHSSDRIHVLYGARDPGNILFRRHIDQWKTQLNFLQTVDSADTDWKHYVGVVPSLFDYISFDPEKTTAFVCGPEVMMRYSVARLLAMGVSAADIYLSMERNMECAIGFCGHCQFGDKFICKDGAVFCYREIADLLMIPEL